MNQKNNNNQYCTECGAKIEGGNYCQECGAKIDNSKYNKKFLYILLIGAGIIIIGLMTNCIDISHYPDHAYQDNIDNIIHYNIPAGYKHIKTEYTAINTQILKTAIYKNKQGQEITVSIMTEGEMYIMGHGKKIPTDTTVKSPDGSVGKLRQEGNFYYIITAENPDILNQVH